MSWVVVIWSMLASACLTLAFTHLVIGAKQPSLRSHLLFAGLAVSVAAIAVFELMLMRSQSIGDYARLTRWIHVPIFFVFVFAVFFVREYFCAGRLWLALLVCAVRLAAVAVNFTSGVNLNFDAITAIDGISFLGETISRARGTLNPLGWLGPLGSLLYVVYVIDASLAAWRSGSQIGRRRAATVGASIVVFIVAATVHGQLVNRGVLDSPYLISIAFFGTIAVMAYELGADAARAADLARALGRNERRMQLAVDAAGIGLWEWDVRRDAIQFIYGNRMLLGASGDAGNLEAFMARIDPQERDAIRGAIRRSLESGADCWLEFRIPDPDGNTPRWIGSRGRVEYGADGKPALMRGVVYDITQRRQAQERVRVVLDATPNGFVMVGAQGEIVMVNAQTERIFGYERSELLGCPIEILLPEALRESHLKHRRSYLANPSAGPMSLRSDINGRRKDGSEVALEIGLTPVDAPEGRFVLAAVVDVSERQRLLRETAQRRDELAHLSRVAVLGELSGSLAHELRQPLTAILSNTQAAQRLIRSNPAEVECALADIAQEGKRALDLIERLRDLFRKGEARREPLDVNAIVLEVLEIVRGELDHRGVSAAVKLAPDLPAVIGDRVQLQQLLMNVIINAADATQSAGADLGGLIVESTSTSSGEVRVSVSDTGPGIAPGDLERIFQPFVTTKKDGLGLGLAVCRTIVEAHGGTIFAENNPAGGATFRLTLPAARENIPVVRGQHPL